MGTAGTHRRRATAVLAAAAVLCLSPGCRLFNRDRDADGGSSKGRGDPLFGGHARIPATDLPVPGRNDGIGRAAKDPLLGAPAGRGERTSNDRPDREPFRNGPGTTPAGLTNKPRLTPDDTGLSLGDRPDKRTEGGPVTLQPRTEPAGSYDDITAGLKQFGAKWAEPVREGGEYLFTCDVPTEGGPDGAVRRYQGAGPTAAAAAREVLDQIKGDRGLTNAK